MSKLKIGIVGNGGISQLHAQSYQALSDRVEIYALCDVNKSRALAMAERLGVPSERVFDNVYDMVRLPELDAVNVCTWNNSHSECTIAALDAGKHVLCEKPMALNAEQAKAMKAAAVRNGKHLHNITPLTPFTRALAYLMPLSVLRVSNTYTHSSFVRVRHWFSVLPPLLIALQPQSTLPFRSLRAYPYA